MEAASDDFGPVLSGLLFTQSNYNYTPFYKAIKVIMILKDLPQLSVERDPMNVTNRK